jgi:hypothetical protein
MDPLDVWKQMSEERRNQAARAFFEDPSLGEFQAAAHAFIAKLKNFRPQFVKRLPLAKRAAYIASLPISAEMASQLVVSWHFAHQRPLMSAFLTALNVPNDNGLIKDDADLQAPSTSSLDAAVETISQTYPREDVNLYLSTLISQNPELWGGLERHITKVEARSA